MVQTLKPKKTIEELQKENLKLQVEIERLKKGYLTKEVVAGTPTDNPVDESLNGWIKEELFIDFDLANSNDVEELIKNT